MFIGPLEISDKEDDFLKSLPEETLRELNRIKELKNYKKGDHIFNEGQKLTGIYYLLSGCAKIVKNKKDGSSRIIHISRPGELLGWERLTEDFYAKDAITLDDTSAYCFPTAAFLELLKRDPSLSFELSKYLCKGKLTLEEKLYQNSLKQKLAANILYLIDRFGTSYNNQILIQVPLTKIDIASLIGTNPETIIKLLSEFKKEQIIDFEDKKLLILNTNILQRFSNL